MVNFRRVFAVITKQMKDTLKNKTILIQYIMFPIMAIIMTELIAKNQDDIPNNMFIVMFATMFIGMIPTSAVANIITEEKEKNSLRVLMMANVKPMEYLLGIGLFTFCICIFDTIIFALAAGVSGFELLRFFFVMLIGIIGSIMLGATVGILCKNQMSATGIILPIGLVLGMLPMVDKFNDKIGNFSKFFYTQQIDYLINDLSIGNFTFYRFAIIIVNIMILLVIFIYSYKKGLSID